MIVLLSGGQDSTTVLFEALREHPGKVHAVGCDYGQKHGRVELSRARKIAMLASVPFEVVRVQWPVRSGLVEQAESVHTTTARGLPNSFVPARNLVFLTLAAGMAYNHDLPQVWIGANAIDYAGYPDCRDAALMLQRDALRSGLDLPNFEVRAPLLHMSKKQIALRARELGETCWAALALSWSCYTPKITSRWAPEVHGFLDLPEPCRVCSACVLRAKGFEEAGLEDPAVSL